MPAMHNDPIETDEFIVAPRWLIPVEPAATVLTNHVAVIRHGHILAIQDRADARQPMAFCRMDRTTGSCTDTRTDQRAHPCIDGPAAGLCR